MITVARKQRAASVPCYTCVAHMVLLLPAVAAGHVGGDPTVILIIAVNV